MCRDGVERARQLVLGAGVVIGGGGSVVHRQVECHRTVAALGACGDEGGRGGDGVEGVVPGKLVAGHSRRVACRGAEHREVQRAEAVASCSGEQGMGIDTRRAVGAVAEGGRLVAADGVEEIEVPCGQHMQHHGQETVGTGGIGQRVVLRTRLGEGAVVPSVRQLAVAHRVVKGAVGLPYHRQMEINRAVASLGIRQYQLYGRVARQRMVVVFVWQTAGRNGVVPCAVG